MEEFNKQESLRLESEQRKRAIKQGTPVPGTVEEFLGLFQKNLQETPLLFEFITREHSENHATIELMERQYERRISEQNNVIGNLEGEIVSLHNSIKELSDNFNLAMNQLLDSQQAHKARVEATCRLIEVEIGS
jgi:uncharacterized coiled-coil protein SlyX